MNISENLIREIVVKVLQEAGANQCPCRQVDPSGIIGIKTGAVQLEPFEGRSDVMLKDVTTLDEAPRMDCCDAILSRRDLEGRQRILKDSHVGSFAVICLAALFLVQFALFASADLTGRRAGLVLICTVSRLCSALAIFLLPPMDTLAEVTLPLTV